MEPGQTRQYSAEQIASELTKRGDEWAEADYTARLLEDTEKTLLAKLTIRYMDEIQENGKKRSAAESEARAMASIEYQGHIEMRAQAKRNANKARVAYDTMRSFSELWRTEQSSLRTEIQSMSRTK